MEDCFKLIKDLKPDAMYVTLTHRQPQRSLRRELFDTCAEDKGLKAFLKPKSVPD